MPRTALQKQRRKEYQAEISRLRRQMRRMEARGYSFERTPSFIPNATPERVTKRDIDRLKKITAHQFYTVAQYTYPGGETITGHQGRRKERAIKARKAAGTRRRNEDSNRGWVGDGEVPPMPDPPTVSALRALLQERSQLIEYGGWIRDRNQGRFVGGTYRDWVRVHINSICQRYAGLPTGQKFAFSQRLAMVLESYFYQYESLYAHTAGALEFKWASAEFKDMVAQLEAALDDLAMIFGGEY